MRVFKRKPFVRFQRRAHIDNGDLARAIRQIGDGIIDADLGGGLYKQRVARKGKGKSGGFRTLIAYRHGARAIFLFGFAKSDRENIESDELEELRKQGRAWLSMTDSSINEAIAENELQEVPYGEEEDQ